MQHDSNKAIEGVRPPRPLGLLAMCGAVLCFSLSSTLVRKAGLPGSTLAFWRMLVTTGSWWLILSVTEHRMVTRAELRGALVPGAVFGINLTLFFTGVTHTSIANAEFIGALTPLIVVPAGALLFHERVNLKSLSFGLISLVGLALVLFNGPAKGTSSWGGNVIIVGAMGTWATYLLTSRRLRSGGTSVQAVMAAIMPIATIAILPIALVNGGLTDTTGTQWLYILGLAVLTGTVAHGFIVFSQKSVPVGTIGIIQVAQPAIAAAWAYVLLDQSIRAIQALGMVLVIIGLILVVVSSRRVESGPQPTGELVRSTG